MGSANATKLRELVNDYYHGLLTKDSYRAQRAALLDALVRGGGGEEFESTRTRIPPPVSGSADPGGTTTSVATTVVEDGPPTPAGGESRSESVARRGGGRLVWIGAGAVVLVVAGVAVVTLMGRQPVGDEPALSESAVTASPFERVLIDFIADNDWSSAEIAELDEEWQALPAIESDAVRSSASFRSFQSELNQRLREENAIAVGGSSPLLIAMLDLAEGMGLSLPRAFASLRDGQARAPAAAAPPVQATTSETETAAASDDPVVAIEIDELPAVTTPVATDPESRAAATSPAASAADRAADSGPADSGAAVESPVPVASTAARESAADPPVAAEPAETDPGPEVADDRPDTCYAALPDERRTPACRDSLRNGADGPVMIVVRPGAFLMGSEEVDEEMPVRLVSIDAAFAISRFEITHGQFSEFCAATGRQCPDAVWGGDEFPVVGVAWSDADAYARWLSAETGHEYSLPSEAEWEYAARAGGDSRYPFGDEITPSAVWWGYNGRLDSPAAIDQPSVNASPIGLMHMGGNVREWVADAWHSSYEGAPVDGSVFAGGDSSVRVVRGGSFVDSAEGLRSAARLPVASSTRDEYTGFRLVRRVIR